MKIKKCRTILYVAQIWNKTMLSLKNIKLLQILLRISDFESNHFICFIPTIVSHDIVVLNILNLSTFRYKNGQSGTSPNLKNITKVFAIFFCNAYISLESIVH